MAARKPSTAHERALAAARQARRRARLKAESLGRPVPPEAKLRRAPSYRPPRASGTVARAAAYARQTRERRAEVIGSLPSIRDPEANLYVPREFTGRYQPEKKRADARARQAEAIREKARGEKIVALGRSRRLQLETDLLIGPNADRMAELMTREQQTRFQQYSRQIASISYQALGILFAYAGGQQDYNSAIERILSSPESRDVEDALAKMKNLAMLAQRAEATYSPRAIGKITV